MNDNIIWHDPLRHQSGGTRTSSYGEPDFTYQAPRSMFEHIVGGPAKMSKRKFGKKKKGIRRVKTNTKLTKDVDVCKKAIKNLRQLSDASTGTMSYRRWTKLRTSSDEMEQGVNFFQCVNKTRLEACISKLLFFDPATSSTLKNVDLTSSSYSKDILIKYFQTSMELRNNYQVDCRVKVYLCEAKAATNIPAATAWTNGIADNAYDTSGSASVTDRTQVGQYPTDYESFNNQWKTKVLLDTVLKSGSSAKIKHSIKDMEYDPAHADTVTDEFQREFKSFGYLIVTQGTVSHDSSVVGEVGIGETNLDCDIHTTAKIQYDAGINVEYVVIDDEILGSFSTGAVQANKPVSDNQSFSVA